MCLATSYPSNIVCVLYGALTTTTDVVAVVVISLEWRLNGFSLSLARVQSRRLPDRKQ